jgi:hypothetical protein
MQCCGVDTLGIATMLLLQLLCCNVDTLSLYRIHTCLRLTPMCALLR